LTDPRGWRFLDVSEWHAGVETAVINGCLRGCKPTGLLIPARLASRQTIRPMFARVERPPRSGAVGRGLGLGPEEGEVLDLRAADNARVGTPMTDDHGHVDGDRLSPDHGCGRIDQ
jgi:hypothetical protein